MPAFLRAANYPQDFDSAAGCLLTTVAGRFDAEYVKGGTFRNHDVALRATAGVPVIDLAAPVADLWVSFRMFSNLQSNSNSVENLRLETASGDMLASLVKVGGTALRARVVGASTVTGATNLGWNSATGTHMDVVLHLRNDGVDRIFDVYFGGILEQSHSVALGSLGDASRIVIGNPWNASNSNSSAWFVLSEVLITDGIDPRGLRVAALRPDAIGHHDQMLGSITGLANASAVTGVASDAAGQRVSWQPEAYTGPTPGGIAAVMTTARAGRLSGAPSRLAQTLRIDGTDHDGDPQTIGATAFWSQVWAANPHTAAPWGVGDLAGLEVGLLSADS